MDNKDKNENELHLERILAAFQTCKGAENPGSEPTDADEKPKGKKISARRIIYGHTPFHPDTENYVLPRSDRNSVPFKADTPSITEQQIASLREIIKGQREVIDLQSKALFAVTDAHIILTRAVGETL